MRRLRRRQLHGPRFPGLVDAASGKLRNGAVTRTDAHTVVLRLSEPDVTLIPNLADYPALLVHRDFEKNGSDLAAHPVGTGPFELVSLEFGQRAVFKRARTAGGGAARPISTACRADRTNGVDPNALVSAFETGEVHTNLDTNGDFVRIFDDMG